MIALICICPRGIAASASPMRAYCPAPKSSLILELLLDLPLFLFNLSWVVWFSLERGPVIPHRATHAEAEARERGGGLFRGAPPLSRHQGMHQLSEGARLM